MRLGLHLLLFYRLWGDERVRRLVAIYSVVVQNEEFLASKLVLLGIAWPANEGLSHLLLVHWVFYLILSLRKLAVWNFVGSGLSVFINLSSIDLFFWENSVLLTQRLAFRLLNYIFSSFLYSSVWLRQASVSFLLTEFILGLERAHLLRVGEGASSVFILLSDCPGLVNIQIFHLLVVVSSIGWVVQLTRLTLVLNAAKTFSVKILVSLSLTVSQISQNWIFDYD